MSRHAAPLARTRVGVLSEIVGYVDFLFVDEPEIDETSWAKAAKNAAILPAVIDAFDALDADQWTAEVLKDALLAVGEASGLKLGKAQAPVRVAVTGRAVGLPLFESLVLLGRARTLSRLRAAAGRVHRD